MEAATINEEQVISERDLEKLPVSRNVSRGWAVRKLAILYFLLASFAIGTVHLFQSGYMGANSKSPQIGRWQLFAENSQGLTKRSRWAMIAEKHHAPLLAAASLSTAVEPNVCPPDGRRCMGELITRLLLQSLAIAQDLYGGEWKITQPHPPYNNNKRSLSNYAFETASELSTQIKSRADTLAALNINLVGRFRSNDPNGLAKRGEEDSEDTYMIETPHGYHLLSPLTTTAGAMFDEIIEQTKSQTVGTIEAARVPSPNVSLKKRDPIRFNVEWISYQWGKSYFYGGMTIPDLHGELLSNFEPVNQYLRNARAWKYCASVHRNIDPSRVTYDSFNIDTGSIYGELYFNTYGPVDKFCLDEKGGAQCPGEACDGTNN